AAAASGAALSQNGRLGVWICSRNPLLETKSDARGGVNSPVLRFLRQGDEPKRSSSPDAKHRRAAQRILYLVARPASAVSDKTHVRRIDPRNLRRAVGRTCDAVRGFSTP